MWSPIIDFDFVVISVKFEPMMPIYPAIAKAAPTNYHHPKVSPLQGSTSLLEEKTQSAQIKPQFIHSSPADKLWGSLAKRALETLSFSETEGRLLMTL